MSRRAVTVAATQMACGPIREANAAAAEALVRRAAGLGAQVILLQELFSSLYFCQEQKEEHFALAEATEDSPLLGRFGALARELGVVLPVSFFERSNNAHFNSVAVFDADGMQLGVYRKSHIPGGPGYQEKFYFNPGDTGFKVWETRFGRIGVAICWDQWFPEAARAMALQGAELLLYPTAIGSEPQDPTLDSRGHWRRVMQGHAAANMVPVVASNRIGTELFTDSSITFYGTSFVADQTGAVVAQCPPYPWGGETEDAPGQGGGHGSGGGGDGSGGGGGGESGCAGERGGGGGGGGGGDGEGDKGPAPEVALATFDLDAIRVQRLGWGLFRDRRPDLYGPLVTLDGSSNTRAARGFS